MIVLTKNGEANKGEDFGKGDKNNEKIVINLVHDSTGSRLDF